MQEVAKEALAQAEEEVTEMAHAVNAEHQVAEAGAEFPGNNAALEKQAQTGLNNLTDAVHDAAEALSEKVDVEVQVTDAITDVASQMVEAKEEGQLASNQTAADDDVCSARVVRWPASCLPPPLTTF
jgi:NADH dehydrogenase FAD-containing subunit